MKVDLQQNDTQIDSCTSSTAASTLSLTAVTTTGMYEKPDNNDKNNSNENDNTITIVPFERHRQEEVVTLFQEGLLSYDFSGNDAWKLVNEWFVTDRLSKEMKDVYTGFNMATSEQQQAAAHDTAGEAGQNEAYASFEGLHFMTAIDSSTDKVVGCVGIKQPDQHTLAVLQQQNAEQSDIISRETNTTCELVRLSVDATCRRRGIGKMLVQAVENFAKRNGYRRVCLTTLKVQTQAVALYQSCGYSVVQEEALDYVPALPQEYLSGNKIMSLVYICKQLD